jgi:hypothetical protein
MDKLDAATTFAGVEERLDVGTLTATDPACIALDRRLARALSGIELRIVHDVWRRRGRWDARVGHFEKAVSGK